MTHIDTDGGSAFQGDFDNRQGVYIGRDLNLNVEVRFSGNQLQALLDQLLALLRVAGVRVQDGMVAAGEETLTVSAAEAEALGKYMADTPAPGSAEREARYLARLCVHPDYQQWQARYVTLSGSTRVTPELTRHYSEIQVRGDGPQRQIERVPLPDIRDALDRYPAFLIKAQPGAGKTTVMQRLALDEALARLHDPASARLPLWVRLAAQKPEESPHEFLARLWRLEMPGAAGDAEAELARALQGGRLCILADALNEARRERYSERSAEWREFAEALPAGNRLLFSCRTLDYGGELAVQQVEIDPLTDEQIEEFGCRYLGDATGAAFWIDLRDWHDTLLPLARTPFYLKMMVEAYEAGGHLPAVRARLFAGFVEKLFGREARRRHPDWIEPAAQHMALSELAFAMQSLGEGTEVSRAWMLNALPASVTLPSGETVATPPDAVLRLANRATLLAEATETGIRFSHHLLQEYFAASELLWRLHHDGEDLADLWRVPSRVGEMPEAERGQWDPLPGPPPSGWEQTTILAAGLDPALIAVVQTTNPALAARGALESGLDWENGEVEAGQIEACRQTLLDRLGADRIHLRSRIEAGLLLGRLKDPRFPVETVGGVRVILPPMVEIAAAMAHIGSGRLDLQAFDDERPRHPVPLDAYAIGRYPVTNAEYACFIEAGGYHEERWWTAGGKYWLRGEPVSGEEDPADYWMGVWRRFRENPAEINELEKSAILTTRDAQTWRNSLQWTDEYASQVFRDWYPQGTKHEEPELWQDPDFNNPSQPVVGVCWYEAAAYANWLAQITGQAYRLPSEPEWEWAARRGARPFPWGRRWDLNRLNSLEGRVMRTTPVGVYPQGATPDGLHDLAGNVLEWTATRYARYPYDPTGDVEDPDATGRRITRGGSWTAHRRMVRCAYRNRNNPRGRGIGLGYRLARASS